MCKRDKRRKIIRPVRSLPCVQWIRMGVLEGLVIALRALGVLVGWFEGRRRAVLQLFPDHNDPKNCDLDLTDHRVALLLVLRWRWLPFCSRKP